MSAVKPLPRKLAATWNPSQWMGVHVLVAVSGGADSVALLRGLAQLRSESQAAATLGGCTGELIVAHVNHGLRVEAQADGHFVEQLARELGCRCITREVDVRRESIQAGDGLEAAARHLRYEALVSMAHEAGARYIATGHTADDQAETILHRIIRGTSVAGLAGIPHVRPASEAVTLIRPLLAIRREEVEAYLIEIEQPFRTDATNFEATFTRNRIRGELLPQLATQYNPAVIPALLRLGESAAEAQATLEILANQLAQRAVLVSHTMHIEVECAELGDAPPHLRSLVIRGQWQRHGWPEQAMTREHSLRLADMTAATYNHFGAVDFPAGVIAQRSYSGRLRLLRS